MTAWGNCRYAWASVEKVNGVPKAYTAAITRSTWPGRTGSLTKGCWIKY